MTPVPISTPVVMPASTEGIPKLEKKKAHAHVSSTGTLALLSSDVLWNMSSFLNHRDCTNFNTAAPYLDIPKRLEQIALLIDDLIMKLEIQLKLSSESNQKSIQATLQGLVSLKTSQQTEIPAGLQPVKTETVGDALFADSGQISPIPLPASSLSSSAASPIDRLDTLSTTSMQAPARITAQKISSAKKQSIYSKEDLLKLRESIIKALQNLDEALIKELQKKVYLQSCRYSNEFAVFIKSNEPAVFSNLWDLVVLEKIKATNSLIANQPNERLEGIITRLSHTPMGLEASDRKIAEQLRLLLHAPTSATAPHPNDLNYLPCMKHEKLGVLYIHLWD